jgi:hypothetical protein
MRLAVLPGALLVLIGCSDRHATPARQSAGRVETRDLAAPVRVTAAPDTAPWTVSEAGYGRIKLGMRQSVAQEALGAPPRSGPEAVTEPCAYMEIPDSPLSRAVGVMLVDGVVGRVDVSEPSVATEWGDRVGDTEAAVLARHAGRVQVTAHPYDGPEGHYLTVRLPGDTLRLLILETDGKRVTSYRVGRRPAVEWVEGCS